MSRVGVDSAMVTVLNTAAQFASLVLFAAIARLFGADASTDAFFLALTLPTVLIGPVVSAVRTVLIPIIAETRAKRPEAQGQFIGCVLLYTLLFAALAVTGLVVVAPLIVPAAAKGMSVESRALVVRLTLLLLPLVVAQSLSAVLSAAYNAVGRFALPSVAAGIRHLVALVLIVAVHGRLGIISLPLAFVAGAVVQLALLAARWRSLDIPLVWSLRTTPEWRRSVRLAGPLIIASVILYLAVLVTRFLASWLPAGSVTVLDYAARITSALMEVLTSGVLVVVLSRWSNLIQSDQAALRASLRRSVVLVLFAVAPVLAALFALRVPAVSLVLGRDSVEPTLILATAAVFSIFLAGVPLDIVARIYSRLFLVRQSTWVNASAALIRLVVVSALALALLPAMGLEGIAIGETAGVASVMFYLVWRADRGAERSLASAGWPLVRIALFALAAGAAAAAVSVSMNGLPALVVLGAGSLAALAVYVGLAALTHSEELQAFNTLLRIPGRRVG